MKTTKEYNEICLIMRRDCLDEGYVCNYGSKGLPKTFTFISLINVTETSNVHIYVFISKLLIKNLYNL